MRINHNTCFTVRQLNVLLIYCTAVCLYLIIAQASAALHTAHHGNSKLKITLWPRYAYCLFLKGILFRKWVAV